MAQQDRNRVETVTVVDERFSAVGTVGETLTFSGSPAYYPNGILEVSKLSNNRWEEIPPLNWAIVAGGIGIKFTDSYKCPAASKIRVIYLPSGNTGGATEVTALAIKNLITLIKDTDGIKKITDPITLAGTMLARTEVSPVSFVRNVAVPGTAIALMAVQTFCSHLVIQGRRSNTNDVFIGDAAVDNVKGLVMSDREFLTMDAAPNEKFDLNKIFVDAEVAGEGVQVMYWS